MKTGSAASSVLLMAVALLLLLLLLVDLGPVLASPHQKVHEDSDSENASSSAGATAKTSRSPRKERLRRQEARVEERRRQLILRQRQLDAGPSASSSSSGADPRAFDMDENRVFNGRPARRGEFPWYVMGHGCGATLVYKDVILSAKHCKESFSLGSEVFVGASRRYVGDYRWTRRSIGHGTADMLVVGLNAYSGKKTALLNTIKRRPSTQAPLRLVGLGETERSSFANVLQKTTVRRVPTRKCRRIYRGDVNAYYELCATQRVNAACYGDSGGPLTLAKKPRVLVGVVSWGPDACEHSYQPAVYARIYGPTARWVESKICLLSKDPPVSCRRRYARQRRDFRRRLQQLSTNMSNTTASGSCTDMPDETFDIRSISNNATNATHFAHSNKDCSWLRHLESPGERRSSCMFSHVAYRCPSTCGVCDIMPHIEQSSKEAETEEWE